MADIKSEITSLYQDKESKLTGNEVANFGYTSKAFTENDATGHSDYDYLRDNNIPLADASTLQTNDTVLNKGYQSQASSITRKLVNHFFGRVSYNLNKTVEVMNGLLSNLSSYIGTANGLATLDENGRIPYSQLPESAIEIKGTWNASTNTPHLINGTGTKGDTYICNVEGYFNPVTGQSSSTAVTGYTHYFANDRIMYDANNVWSRLPAGNIQSVNGVRPDSDNNVQITIKCTKAQYDAWTNKSGKFFVITDSSGLDQTLINDNSTATDTTWSSSKIDSNLNSALANLSETKIETKTDCNQCIPTSFKTSKYFVAYDGSNIPTNKTSWIIESSIRSDIQIVQLAYSVDNNNYKLSQYIRQGAKSNNTWTFSDWTKLTTESDLSSYVNMLSYNGTKSGIDGAKELIETNYATLKANKNHFLKLSANGQMYFVEVYKTNDNYGAGRIWSYSVNQDLYFRVSGGTFIYEDVVNESDLNSALEGYDVSNAWTNTLLSIVDNTNLKKGKSVTYTILDTTITDLPVAKIGIVKTRKNSTNNRAIQIYQVETNDDITTYKRQLVWSGTNWLVQNSWQKLTTETDLNSAFGGISNVALTEVTSQSQKTVTSGRVQYLVRAGFCHIHFVNVKFTEDIGTWQTMFNENTFPKSYAQEVFTISNFGTSAEVREYKITLYNGKIQNADAIPKDVALSGEIMYPVSQ